jgi:hypothetical protein
VEQTARCYNQDEAKRVIKTGSVKGNEIFTWIPVVGIKQNY